LFAVLQVFRGSPNIVEHFRLYGLSAKSCEQRQKPLLTAVEFQPSALAEHALHCRQHRPGTEHQPVLGDGHATIDRLKGVPLAPLGSQWVSIRHGWFA
jgi:hypothetical protein